MTAAADVLDAFRVRGRTLSCAESCTGGLIAARLTEAAGATDAFVGGIVAYADRAKSDVLGVDAKLVRDAGAVSARVAEAMARACRERFDTDVALAVTGIAGPGAPPGLPVGLVYLGVATRHGARAVERRYEGDRERVRRQAVDDALALAIEALAQ